ncbi:MAG TPA: aminoglycoside phosphotransferase family protein, partial [Caulobacteraceae bacterium]|nr:aminoglycoside phosphotransferase family protein [Caulobacteraceae bacterium]
IFRLGDDLALRLPRRHAARPLIEAEQRWLPVLKDRLPLAVPAPVRVGAPTEAYPTPWSIVPWFEGETADLAPPDAGEAEALAAFFTALHVAAPADAPRNPYRGVPLTQRQPMWDVRVGALERRGEGPSDAVRRIWDEAVAADVDMPPVWIQGDPHPRNILVRDGRLAAMLDWGDMAAGDRASDLASVWMLFAEREARERAMAAMPAVTAATWTRARGWAALYGVMLLDAGLEDDPRMEAIARKTFARIVEGP